jgi:glycosyltransferase involved in cell wall biosynthesis
MKHPLRFLFLEPFFGGSHGDFAQGLTDYSRHDIDLFTMPDRFWKWRMRGAALYWADRIKTPERYDGLIVSSMMSLAELMALWANRCPPALVYFHENQLTYPAAPGERADHQPGFTNISTALAAKQILFNSQTHLDAFLSALPDFIRIMPDCRPKWAIRAIEEKCAVAYPGCHFPNAPFASRQRTDQRSDRTPLIIWNHRWEHDKNPEAFFQALERMQSRGIDFRVALLGEAYAQMPEVFKRAPEQLGNRLVHHGRAATRQKYYRWLSDGSVVISTARQENFGIAVVEAMYHGCLPLLPNRLSYPEILPEAFHSDFLYDSQQELEDKLAGLLINKEHQQAKGRALSCAMRKFSWKNTIAFYDEKLSRLAARTTRTIQ